jgi:ABC-type multidrug transport system fused ATPase/permease subunit
MKEIPDLAEARTLALAIVDTLPEPFLVLDDSLSSVDAETEV